MYKKFIIPLISILIIYSLSGCNQSTQTNSTSGDSTAVKGTISISGAFALYPMTVKWAEEFQKLHPEVRIDISAGGAGKGMTDALSGMVDLGMFSRGISQEEKDKGVWWVAVTKDAVFPTVSAKNPELAGILASGITQPMFVDIFITEKITKWNQLTNSKLKEKINVYTRSDACGAAEMWGKYLGQNQETLKGIGVFGDPGIAEAVKNDKYGIGYNNLNYIYDLKTHKIYDGLAVIPIDLNGNRKIDPEENFYNSMDSVINAINIGKYPSPPARDLYFVAKGKPSNPLIIKFLQWILTEGQYLVNQGGYVKLADETIQSELLKLK
jgi:phosphate transport system substrate-binding protein